MPRVIHAFVCFAVPLIIFTVGASAQAQKRQSGNGGKAAVSKVINASALIPGRDVNTLFQKVNPAYSNVWFGDYSKLKNRPDSASGNFMVVGGGVAIGDFNGDGLPDIVLGNYYEGVRLYKNLGDFKFAEVTSSAIGNLDCSLPTGITMADVDGDGDQDILVCRMERPIRMLINDGKGRFVNRAKERGVEVSGQIVNGSFFDADSDGDLDLYLVFYGLTKDKYDLQQIELDSILTVESQSPRTEQGIVPVFFSDTGVQFQSHQAREYYNSFYGGSNDPNRMSYTELRHQGIQDKFFLNDGSGTFQDYTYNSWIVDRGMGLSATTADINNDGHVDLYVSNDFSARDLLYLNNGDATFANVTTRAISLMSVFSMGTDVADFNNDLWPDILSVDMYPRDHFRRISRLGVSGDFSHYSSTFDSNQVMRNCLQLNRGNGTFSEIGFAAGIAATDWSWGALFFDADLDGWKDIFIVNGYLQDLSDQDYVYNLQGDASAKLKRMPPLREPDFAFRNMGDLTFGDSSASWGVNDVSGSLGSAYGDLDGDGDLDYIVCNFDTTVSIYRNMAVERRKGNWLQFDLDNEKWPNTKGLGSKVILKYGGQQQVQELAVSRGFMSSVQPLISFGVGTALVIDTVIVQWHAGGESHLFNVEVNKRHTLKRSNALPIRTNITPPASEPLFVKVDVKGTPLDVVHKENNFDDFKRERLLPWRISWDGPGVAVGDVNGDGLTDLYVGGSAGNPGRLLLQTSPGVVEESTPEALSQDSLFEDVGVLFFDSNGDGHLDLYVARGGLEAEIGEPEAEDQLYLGNGSGGFVKAPFGTLPEMRVSSSVVTAADYDGDGDLDLFVGGRVLTGVYPLSPASCILRNDNGRFVDVTNEVAPEVRYCGMVKTALWTDINNDGLQDLIVSGDWMPVKVFMNRGGRLVETTKDAGLDKAVGFWNTIASADVDNDGDMDYVVGNIGWNTRFGRPNQKEPIRIYAADFDDNGSTDPIITYVQDGTEWVMRDRSTIVSQMPVLQREYNTYVSFARTPFKAMFGSESEAMDTVHTFAATELASVVLINDGNGRFEIRVLPAEIQIAPLIGLVVADVNGDGNLDLITSGNLIGADREMVKYNAGRGLIALGDGTGSFRPVELLTAGFNVPGDGRALVLLGGTVTNEDIVVAFANQDKPSVWRGGLSGKAVVPPSGVTFGTVTLSDGRQRRVELPYGGGYLCQTPQYVRVDGAVVTNVTFGIGVQSINQRNDKR